MKTTVKVILATIAISFVSGCATSAPARVKTVNKYDPAETAWAREEGTGVVIGSAMVRTKKGDVLHCGALEVQLIPMSVYRAERARLIYGNATKKVISHRATAFAPTPDGVVNLEAAPALAKLDVLITACDADGDFEFYDVPEGEWFIHTTATQSRFVGSDNMFVSSTVEDAVWWMQPIYVESDKTTRVRLN